MSGRALPLAATCGARPAGSVPPLGPRLRRALAGLLAAGALSLLSGPPLSGAASAEVAPPPELRVTWEYSCQSTDKGPSRFVLTGSAIEDGEVVFASEWHGKSATRHLPLSAWPLAYFSRVEAPGFTRLRAIDWGTLAFGKLAVGETATAWVRQFHTRWGRNRWKWTAEIVEVTDEETEGFGTLQVYVIEARVHSAELRYGWTLVNHYAPELNMITYIKHHDSDDRVEECHLVSRK